MKARALSGFFDIKEQVAREKGDVFELDEKRFEELVNSNFGCLVEAVEEKKPRARKKAE